MTDNPAKTVGRKRKKYVPYNSLPQRGLNVDMQRDGEMQAFAETPDVTTRDIATLIRVIADKDRQLENQVKTIHNQQEAMIAMFEDINYLKSELSNPNLFIAE